MSDPRRREPVPPGSEAQTAKIDTPVVGRLISVGRDGTVRVAVPGHGEAIARLLASVSRAELGRSATGRELLVVCEGGDPALPVVIGILEDPAETLLALADDPAHRVFTAEGSITLLCGEASLTLHSDGRVVTRGVNVVSVASEQQRIQGAVVKIN